MNSDFECENFTVLEIFRFSRKGQYLFSDSDLKMYINSLIKIYCGQIKNISFSYIQDTIHTLWLLMFFPCVTHDFMKVRPFLFKFSSANVDKRIILKDEMAL